MKKIGIYYIATNKYIQFLPFFLNGIKNFMPNTDKKIIIITNKIEEAKEITKDFREYEFKYNFIIHQYWPIPALFKMFYINMFFDNSCDYHFYFNSNCVFNKELILEDKEMFFMNHYLSDRLSLVTINNGNNNNCIIPPNNAECSINPNSVPNNAIYFQSGFFGGRSECMKKILCDINEMMQKDLKHNIIPIWHDETYLNVWALKNIWNKIQDNYQIINMYNYATFIDKTKYFDKFNA